MSKYCPYRFLKMDEFCLTQEQVESSRKQAECIEDKCAWWLDATESCCVKSDAILKTGRYTIVANATTVELPKENPNASNMPPV